MSVFSLCGMCLCGAVAAMILRELKRDYVPFLVLSIGVAVCFAVLPRIGETVAFAREISSHVNGEYAGALLRALGIAYLTSIAADICRAAGETSIVSYIETAGKLEIIALSLPLIGELLSLALLK